MIEQKPSIVVIGTTALDVIVLGLPEESGFVSRQLVDPLYIAAGGSAGNCASALKRLDVRDTEIVLISRMGQIHGCKPAVYQHYLNLEFPSDGLLYDEDAVSPSCISLVTDIQSDKVEPLTKERTFLFHPGEGVTVSLSDLRSERIKGIIENARCIHFAGVGNEIDENGCVPAVLDEEFPNWAKSIGENKENFFISADFVSTERLEDAEWRRRADGFLHSVDIMVPCDTEGYSLLAEPKAPKKPQPHGVALLQNRVTKPGDLRDLAHALRAAYQPACVVVKGAEYGCWVYGSLPWESALTDACVSPLEIICVLDDKRPAVDPTGAGDCWCAGFIAGIYQGLPLIGAACAANVTAAWCLTGHGGCPTDAKKSLACPSLTCQYRLEACPLIHHLH